MINSNLPLSHLNFIFLLNLIINYFLLKVEATINDSFPFIVKFFSIRPGFYLIKFFDWARDFLHSLKSYWTKEQLCQQKTRVAFSFKYYNPDPVVVIA